VYGQTYNAPLWHPEQSRVHVRRPNRRDVSLAATEKCKCQCWITKWWWQIVPQFGSQAAKLRGRKLDVRQTSTCKSPRAAEHRWRQLVLAVTDVQSLKTILSGTGNQWRSSRSVGVMRSNLHFRIMNRAAECKTDCSVFVAVVFIHTNLNSPKMVIQIQQKNNKYINIT